MDNEIKKDPDEIIKSHVIFSMTAGAIPIPLADIAAVTAIQVDMIKQLAQFYGADFDQNKGKTIVSAVTGATAARIGASIVKSIPGVGTLIGIGMQMILSGASTYALGHLFKNHFSKSGTMLNISLSIMKKSYDVLFKQGKKFARKIKGTMKKDDTIATIEKLKDLRRADLITEEEFQKTKAKILAKMSE